MKIVDLHLYRGPHLYCGRAMPGRKGSPLANPFKFPSYSVRECLDLYREWLDLRIADNNKQVMRALASITADTALACWCVTLDGEAIFTSEVRCHCQLIARAWRKLNELPPH